LVQVQLARKAIELTDCQEVGRLLESGMTL